MSEFVAAGASVWRGLSQRGAASVVQHGTSLGCSIVLQGSPAALSSLLQLGGEEHQLQVLLRPDGGAVEFAAVRRRGTARTRQGQQRGGMRATLSWARHAPCHPRAAPLSAAAPCREGVRRHTAHWVPREHSPSVRTMWTTRTISMCHIMVARALSQCGGPALAGPASSGGW